MKNILYSIGIVIITMFAAIVVVGGIFFTMRGIFFTAQDSKYLQPQPITSTSTSPLPSKPCLPAAQMPDTSIKDWRVADMKPEEWKWISQSDIIVVLGGNKTFVKTQAITRNSEGMIHVVKIGCNKDGYFVIELPKETKWERNPWDHVKRLDLEPIIKVFERK